MSKTKRPAAIAELAPDPDNPRLISDDAARGLGRSLQEFGDLSGITYNLTTGELVTGHQRVAELQRKHGPEIEIAYDTADRGVLVTPNESFSVRIVRWSKEKQRVANLAANHLEIQGHYELSKLEIRLRTVERDKTTPEDHDVYADLLLDRLEDELESPSPVAPASADDTPEELLGKSFSTLSCELTDKQEEVITAAIEKAQERRTIKTIAEALAVICKEWNRKR